MNTNNVINIKYIRRHERVFESLPQCFIDQIKHRIDEKFGVLDLGEMEGSGGGETFIYSYDPETKTVIGTTISNELDAYEFCEIMNDERHDEAKQFAAERGWTHFMVVSGYENDSVGQPIIDIYDYSSYCKFVIEENG